MLFKSVIYGSVLATYGHIVFRDNQGSFHGTSIDMPRMLGRQSYIEALLVRDNVEKSDQDTLYGLIAFGLKIKALTEQDATFLCFWVWSYNYPNSMILDVDGLFPGLGDID